MQPHAEPLGQLAEHHRRELRDGSAISLEVIAELGCWTASTRAEVESLGYAEPWQQLVPALVFPVHPPDGSNSLYVLKPDMPRPKSGKPGKFIKYEWPAGSPHRLDVPPTCRTALDDPSVDLHIVEGSKKAACLAAHGYCAVAIWGTWAWGRKPSESARCELLPDWDLVPLDGRIVYITFDSDIVDKREVDLGARQLAARLSERGALVYLVRLPNEPDGRKNGADDLIARHGPGAFAERVEEAEPWGSAGITRKLEADKRALQTLVSAIGAVMLSPTLTAADKVGVFVIATDTGWLHSKGEPTPFHVNYGRLARCGLSKDTLGAVLKRLDEGGVVRKRVVREPSGAVNVQGRPAFISTVELTPLHADGVVGMLRAAAPRCP